jgi:siroheme decarboxylase
MMILTAQDKLLLNRIQENFPVDIRPYAVIGKELNMSEEEVVERVRRLRAEGYIRRIGPFFNSRKLGYTSTLVAFAVPDEKVEETAKIINRYIGVTHNYIRPGTYNMWFTFIASGVEQLQQSLADICQKTGISDMLVLPSTHTFKVNVNLRIMEDGK